MFWCNEYRMCFGQRRMKIAKAKMRRCSTLAKNVPSWRVSILFTTDLFYVYLNLKKCGPQRMPGAHRKSKPLYQKQCNPQLRHVEDSRAGIGGFLRAAHCSASARQPTRFLSHHARPGIGNVRNCSGGRGGGHRL